MENASIESRTLKLITDHLGLSKPPALTDKLVADLGADSLDLVEIAMFAEDEFCIEIDDEKALECVTVADTIALVNACQPS